MSRPCAEKMKKRNSISGGRKGFFYSKPSRPNHGPTHRPIQRLPEALAHQLKRPEPESNYIHQSSDKEENSCIYSPIPPQALIARA
jgi:hypothetical protein